MAEAGAASGERNVDVELERPTGTAGTVGDFRDACPGDFTDGDLSLGSRDSRLPCLVGDKMVSLPRLCLAGETAGPWGWEGGTGSRGEIWWPRADRSELQLSRRSRGEVESTSCANLGRGSDIGSADAEVLRLASRTGAA